MDFEVMKFSTAGLYEVSLLMVQQELVPCCRNCISGDFTRKQALPKMENSGAKEWHIPQMYSPIIGSICDMLFDCTCAATCEADRFGTRRRAALGAWILQATAPAISSVALLRLPFSTALADVSRAAFAATQSHRHGGAINEFFLRKKNAAIL